MDVLNSEGKCNSYRHPTRINGTVEWKRNSLAVRSRSHMSNIPCPQTNDDKEEQKVMEIKSPGSHITYYFLA